MNVQKISVSLPQQQYEFVENYQVEHHYKTRSEVIKDALNLLQQVQLEQYYQEANQELDSDFDTTISDGIEENEPW
jgi:antitoxin ParD1/3/4